MNFPHGSFSNIKTRVEGTGNEEMGTALFVFMKIGTCFSNILVIFKFAFHFICLEKQMLISNGILYLLSMCLFILPGLQFNLVGIAVRIIQKLSTVISIRLF